MDSGGRVPRRRVLQLLVGSVAAGGSWSRSHAAAPTANDSVSVGDGQLQVAIDRRLHTRLVATDAAGDHPLTLFAATETITLADGVVVTDFHYAGHDTRPLSTVHGPGVEHAIRGVCTQAIEKTLLLTFPIQHTGTALLRVRYRNVGDRPVGIARWTSAAHTLSRATPATEPAFWSFSGASHEDRRDWVQPVRRGFHQRNYLGMNASDYGGGTPVVDVWRRDRGLAVGHLETRPQLIALPITESAAGARIAIEGEHAQTLAPGEAFETIDCFVYAHTGDYYAALDLYRRLMDERGIRAPRAPDAAFGPIWCAWGYERNFTTAQVEGTLAKARELGFEWAVLDDGWQTSEGDWYVDRSKFPRGEADLVAFADHVKAAGLKPRLWFSPLAVNPGTDLLHDHVDMLLLDKNGATQNVSWWNAFYLCPAYRPTVDYYVALVEKIIGEWGYAGLKLDGQHLNGVAPCYNPAHRHARPEESIEQLQDFWAALYRAALKHNPQAVVELCPCGTSFAFHNVASMNQTPASDPESSWQVRHKGKTLKALLGTGASYAGDHVELSDRGRDFASTVGLGAVISTKFTWPEDTRQPTAPQPPGGYRLTAEKEALWRQWVGIYRDKMLPQGRYLGSLYDIGFDKPECHAIERNNRLYYAFFAKQWNGAIELRGLGPARYEVTDYVTGRPVGSTMGPRGRLHVEFADSLLLEATPIAAQV